MTSIASGPCAQMVVLSERARQGADTLQMCIMPLPLTVAFGMGVRLV